MNVGLCTRLLLISLQLIFSTLAAECLLKLLLLTYFLIILFTLQISFLGAGSISSHSKKKVGPRGLFKEPDSSQRKGNGCEIVCFVSCMGGREAQLV